MGKKKVASDTPEEAVKDPAASVEANSPQESVQTPAPATLAPDLPVAVSASVAVGSKAALMKAFLDTQPKVAVFIPLSSGEKPGVTQPVILNGYALYVRKGQQVLVPAPVAEVLEVKLKNQISVQEHPDRLGAGGEPKMTVFGS